MKQLKAAVISNQAVGTPSPSGKGRRVLGYRLTWLECPAIAREARPGQFVMVEGGPDSTLRRPLSIHRVEGDRLALYYAVLDSGPGTNWLAARESGDNVDIIGSLGNGFTLPEKPGKLLLVAGGMGLAPLTFLAGDACKLGHRVMLLVGAQTTAQFIDLPETDGLEILKCTEDGSAGHKGLVTSLMAEQAAAADAVCICGPLPMYRAIAGNKELLAGNPAQVSLEVRMGCGTGLCFSCTIPTRNGLKQVCKDGPVFDFDDVIWDGVAC